MTSRPNIVVTWLPVVALAALMYFVVSCSQDSSAPNAAQPVEAAEPTAAEATAGPAATAASLPPGGTPDTLAEWGQLSSTDGQLVLADGVIPYTLNSPLFSDYAHKLRTVWVPDGSPPATYDDQSVFDFPVGTVITKTFYYPVADGENVLKAPPDDAGLSGSLELADVRLIETRVLVRRATGWVAHPYVWNDDETEATLQRIGDLQMLTLVDDQGETPFIYVVPDVNQCTNCHATDHTKGAIQPIGPKARHLNTEVDLGAGLQPQLEAWQLLGLVGDLPANAGDIPAAPVWTDAAVSLEDRARAYLDINCSHCRNEAGAADTSALFLDPWIEIGPSFGVCKAPIAAGTGTGGRLVGIDPGSPEDSIFVYRMDSIDPGEMMPEVGRSLAHTEGVDLVTEWIASLAGSC